LHSRSIAGGALRADVAIIGAGPAGLTIARELAAVGIDVVLLESGNADRNGKANRLNRGDSVGYPFPLASSRNRAFGGTSSVWRETTGLRVRPLDAIDLEASRVSGAPEWPLSADELDCAYRSALEDLGLESAFEPGDWGVAPSEPLAAYQRIFLFGPSDRFVSLLKEVECSHRIQLVLDATVSSLESDENGREVMSLTVRTKASGTFRVSARRFVLASGGIENARLLLASRGSKAEGLANHNDLVGRFFMDHLSMDVAYQFPLQPNLDLGPFQEHARIGGVKLQAMFALPESELREWGLMNAAMWLAPVHRSEMARGVRAARALRYSLTAAPRRRSVAKLAMTAARSPRAVSSYLRSRRSGVAADAVAFRIMAEQAPRPGSRVMLASRTDEMGMPRVALNWQISPVDRASIDGHIQGLRKTFRRLGLGDIAVARDLDQQPLVANHHHLGTTRMHVNPRLGVVDAECRVHQVHNLFIAGSSVFPSGGYVNPTLTILALARRLAKTVSADLASPTG
jgi:choline dehydrogenase-like flavoprotein